MKKYLISPHLNQYKANMHSHSRCSDGRLTIEELKTAYKERGYSIIAYSDHRTVRDHRTLADDDFLPLISAEMDVTELNTGRNGNLIKSFHYNVIARDPDSFEQVKSDPGNCCIEGINAVLKDAKDKNYFVVANHPNWSLFTEDEFLQLEHLDGFELYNCITANYGGALSFTPEIYLYLLRNGKRIYPIGGDDNHSFKLPFSDPHNDSFGGFTYILSDELKYEKIISALDDGNMYCSTGPQFFEISATQSEIHIKCSEVKQINIITENGKAFSIRAIDGETVNELSCNVSDGGDFFVVCAFDTEGKPAMTRAFYRGEDY